MSVIELEFRSNGANTSIRDLNRFQTIIKSTDQGVAQLARQLKITYGAAKQFSANLGVTSQKASAAVKIINDLRKVNANNAQIYKVLNTQLGITREEFLKLNSEVKKVENSSQGVTQLAQALNISSNAAQQFSSNIGLTAQKTTEAVQLMQQLQSTNTSSGQIYQTLNRQLGITRSQFNALNQQLANQTNRFENNSQQIARLAQTLNTSFSAARKFANEIGLSANRTQQAIARIKELNTVNANAAQKYRTLSRELGLNREQFTALNQQVRSQSQQLSTIQLGAIAVGARQVASGLTDIGTQAVETFVGLESQINQFQAISGETDAVVEEVKNVVEELGSTTAKTAVEVGRASVVLARMGFTGEQVANILPAIAKGSVATGESTEILSTVLGRVINQFQETGASQGRFLEINDLLVNAANSSATNINDLGEALGFAGATAKQSGQDIETSVAVIGLLANAGIDSTRAGVAFSNVLTRLRNAAAQIDDPTNKAAAALKSLNVNITDSRGQLLDFGQTLPLILDSLRNIENVGQQGVLLNDIFGIRQARDFNALLNLSNEEIKSFIQNIEFSSGASQQAADTILQGLSGSFAEFNSALEGLSSSTGETIGVVLEPIVRGATDLVRTFSELPAPIRATLVSFGGFAAAISAAIAVVAGLTAANRLLGFSETAVAAGTTALNIARNAGTIATTINTVATQKLTVATIAQKGATLATAAAENVRAIATGKAAAATVSANLAVAGSLGTLAGATAAIALAVDTYRGITKESANTEKNTNSMREALVKLDEVMLNTAESGEEVKSAIASIAEQNLEQLTSQLSPIQKILDKIREPLPGQTAATAAANQQTIAFSKQLTVVDEVLAKAGNLRGEIIATGNINKEQVNAQVTALQEIRSALAQEKPTTEAAVQAKQNYLNILDKNIKGLNGLSEGTVTATNIQGENTEGTEAQTEALEKQTEALKILKEELTQGFEDQEIAKKEEEEDNKTRRERTRATILENLKDESEQARQQDQFAFQDEIEAVKRQYDEDRNAIARELEEELVEIKKTGEAEIQTAEKEFTDSQNAEAKEFAKELQDDAKKFQAELAKERKELEAGFDDEISSANRDIDRTLALDGAEDDEEREKLRQRFAAQDEAAKKRAALEAELLEPILARREEALLALKEKEAEFEAAQEVKEAEFKAAQDQAKLDFETGTLAPLRAELENQLQEQKIANEAYIAEIKLAQDEEIKAGTRAFNAEQDALKKETEEQIIARKQQYEDDERNRNRNFESELRENKRAFEAELRSLNLQNAKEVKQVIESTGSDGIPAFKDGGSAQPGLALVGEQGAELVNFTRPGYVHTAQETRSILNGLNFNRPNLAQSTTSVLNSQTNNGFNQQAIATLQRIETKLTKPVQVKQQNQFVNTYTKNNQDELLRKTRSEMTSILNDIANNL